MFCFQDLDETRLDKAGQGYRLLALSKMWVDQVDNEPGPDAPPEPGADAPVVLRRYGRRAAEGSGGRGGG